MPSYWFSVLLQTWIWTGTLVFARRFRRLRREEKQVSNPDSSFYRRNDNALLRLMFYFILWCLTPALLYGLWLHWSGQLRLTGHGV